MTTQKQIEANRRNAARSTGPRTDEGKRISALNALQHGMTSETPVLPTEDPVGRKEFRSRLLLSLAPEGAVEELLAEEVIDCSWRLRRARNVELGVLAGGVAALDQRFFHERRRRLEVTEGDIVFARRPSLDDVVEITYPDAHDLLTMQIDDTEDVQRSEEVRLGAAFVEDAAGPNALAKLSRYETGLLRQRDRALDRLSALQAERKNGSPRDPE